jgi:putative ABC transport system permease protein
MRRRAYLWKRISPIFFTWRLIAGSTAGFSDPNTILLGQSVAQSLFGREEAVGKIVKLDNVHPVKVIGVFEDLPLNSSFSGIGFLCPYDLLVNTDPGVKSLVTDWNNSSVFVYADVQPGMSDEVVSNAIKEVYWSKIKGSATQIPGNKVELFLVIVLAATFIAIPIAYYVAHSWLEGYEYRTDLSWWIFVVTGAGILLTTLITVSVHAIKAAMANPVRSLRTQ